MIHFSGVYAVKAQRGDAGTTETQQLKRIAGQLKAAATQQNLPLETDSDYDTNQAILPMMRDGRFWLAQTAATPHISKPLYVFTGEDATAYRAFRDDFNRTEKAYTTAAEAWLKQTSLMELLDETQPDKPNQPGASGFLGSLLSAGVGVLTNLNSIMSGPDALKVGEALRDRWTDLLAKLPNPDRYRDADDVEQALTTQSFNIETGETGG
jgi:hypothetical protein